MRFNQWLTDEAAEVLRRYGGHPELPPRGVSGPVTQAWPAFGNQPPMRNHTCELDGVEVDGHEGSDLDPGSTACIHCDYEGPNP